MYFKNHFIYNIIHADPQVSGFPCLSPSEQQQNPSLEMRVKSCRGWAVESEDSAQSWSRAQSSTCPVPKSRAGAPAVARSVACPSKSEREGEIQHPRTGNSQAKDSAHSTGVRAEGSHPCFLPPLSPQPRAATLCRAWCPFPVLGQAVTANSAEPLSPTSSFQQSLSLPQHLRMRQDSHWAGSCNSFSMRCGTEEHCRPVPTMAGGAEVSQGPVGCWGSAEEICGIHHLIQVEFT